MTPPLRLVTGLLAGALVGAVLGFLIGGGVVFGRSLVADLWRPEGGFSIVLENGARIAAIVGRLFALPAAIGGGVAGLVAFRPGRKTTFGRRPGVVGPAVTGLVVAALAAPAGLGLYASEVLGPVAGRAGALPLFVLLRAAVLCGVAGLLAGLAVGRLAAGPARGTRLR
ncbi:MAG TPA: hypothetical protein VIM86_03915 [Thermodesulfobacteriota bacterium]